MGKWWVYFLYLCKNYHLHLYQTVSESTIDAKGRWTRVTSLCN